ncbi:AAA family ATPase [PVC group bacterium]|nr:AAA family ATPase [PVC group bacterium]
MSYFKVLGFQKEPFSTSPDPEFFYQSKEHEKALTHILIELRLKGGLSVILGDVGIGKTTLSRKLIQELRDRDDFIFHIILDPSFENEQDFLTSLIRNFDIPQVSGTNVSVNDLRESLERFLFQKAVHEGKTVTLIIDEAQKLNATSLEALRVLLNYETNEYKLIQLVLLGQLELHSRVMNIPNFLDRISFKYMLNPLDFKEVKEMIYFRMLQAGYDSRMDLFLDNAMEGIYEFTKGYPRKIIMLCRRALKSLVLKNKYVVDAELVRELIEEEAKSGWTRSETLLQKSNC